MLRISNKLLSVIMLMGFWAAPLAAAELVMFEEAGCPWCRRWHAEVGPGYPKSPEGRRAPLRVVDAHAQRPQGLAFIKGVRATPTFVLIDGGREIGRITGYPGADFFWGLLAEMLQKLPSDGNGATRCPSGGRGALSAGNSC